MYVCICICINICYICYVYIYIHIPTYIIRFWQLELYYLDNVLCFKLLTRTPVKFKSYFLIAKED